MSQLVIGYGYLGARVARLWQDAGHRVYAMTRSAVRAESMRQCQLLPIVGDITDPATLVNLPDVDTVLLAVGYDRHCGKPLRQIFVDGIDHVLQALPASVSRLIYISSTGVFGQDDGEWVDESSPCQPRREGGRACLDAERLIAKHDLGKHAVILRMAGLYGPGRVPRQASIERGEPIASPAHGYLNLIHVDDAAAIVVASAAVEAPRTYIVSDGTPVLRGDYFGEVARRLHAPAPVFTTADPASHATARAAADKRVSNRRLMTDFKFTLKYPSYREGLAAILS